MRAFDAFLEIAGNLGFLVGNNDRKRDRERMAKRSWGAEQDGFALSLSASSLASAVEEGLQIEVALKNLSGVERALRVASPLVFFPLEISGPDAMPVELTAFGRQQLGAAQETPVRESMLAAGATMQADFPVKAIYQMQRPGVYMVKGGCSAVRAVSNELQIRIEIA